MSDREDHRLIRQCWANRGTNSLGYTQRCLERVPNDPDHIGLCDGCRQRLRGDEDMAWMPCGPSETTTTSPRPHGATRTSAYALSGGGR